MLKLLHYSNMSLLLMQQDLSLAKTVATVVLLVLKRMVSDKSVKHLRRVTSSCRVSSWFWFLTSLSFSLQLRISKCWGRILVSGPLKWQLPLFVSLYKDLILSLIYSHSNSAMQNLLATITKPVVVVQILLILLGKST
jgi:hypothetical protein